MTTRDDIPRPSGSLSAEQRQAMARIEMRRAERLRKAESGLNADESGAQEPLSLLDEPVSAQPVSTDAPDERAASIESAEWSLEEPSTLPERTQHDALEIDRAGQSATDTSRESEIALTRPGLLPEQPDVGRERISERTNSSAEAGTLHPNDVGPAASETALNASALQASFASVEKPADPDQGVPVEEEELPKVAEVARDIHDYQALRASKSPMKRLVDDLSSRMFRNSIGLASTAVVLAVAVALLVWSVFFRLDILNEVVALEMIELDLEDKHSTLALQLSALNADSMESEIEEQSTRIFPGFPALANWIERVSERAEGMNMMVRYRVEPASYAPVDEVLEVPVIIELEVASEDDDELFGRGMGLIASLLQDHWHLDIASTSAKGDGKGMRTLEMEARVWVFDVEEFISSSLVADGAGRGETGREFGGDAEIIQ